MVGAAKDCGYLKDIPQFVSEDDMGYVPDDKLIMIVTGSQGEARAQLARMARGEHQEVTFHQGDTVIFFSRRVPFRGMSGKSSRLKTILPLHA